MDGIRLCRRWVGEPSRTTRSSCHDRRGFGVLPGYYFTDIQYETDPGKGTTNVLSFISHEEGRVIPDPQSGQLTYEYHYRDHLGNLRVSFRQQSQQSTTARLSMEPLLATREEAAFSKVSESRTAGPAHSGRYAARLMQQQTGPGKTVKLQPGETLKASVFGYVEPSRKRRTTWQTLSLPLRVQHTDSMA